MIYEPEKVTEITPKDPLDGVRETERNSALGLGGFIVNNGWIKLHRKILKNPICTKPTWAWLWVVLLLLANHEEGDSFIWNGQIMKLNKGQFVTGRKKLKELTGIPESTIERALTHFEKIGQQIEQQKTTKYRLITILNWNDYQKTDNRRTTDGQQTDTFKNVKKYKNIKNIVAGINPANPYNEAKDFFTGGSTYTEIYNSLSQNTSPEIIKRELDKFIFYWTEKNKSGTRERWEQERTFEVKRRLFTWLSRVKEAKNKKGKEIV